MPNYQEGKIYKIYNTINDDIYVGSTTRKLCERMGEHRSRVKYRDKHKPLSQSILEHGVENFFIELIEKCPCNDKDELLRTEGKYIRELKPSMNKIIAGRTRKEHYIDNKEHLSQRAKEWREVNPGYMAQKNKEWRENNKEAITCECGCDVTRNHLARHKRSAKHNQLMNK